MATPTMVLKDTALLRLERRDRGLTIKQAAVQIGIGVATLQRIEAGDSSPQPATAASIARFYGKLPSEIWDMERKGEVGPIAA